MKPVVSRWGLRSLCAWGLVAAFPACHEKVSLGGWSDPLGTSTSGGLGGAAATVDTATTTSLATASSGATGGASTTGTVGVGGAAGDTGEPSGLPACLAEATPGPFNVAGPDYRATETASDWTWPKAMTSLEWEIRVEREIVSLPIDEQIDTGYYYSHQFSFQGGNPGVLGIQAEGGYDEPPRDTTFEFTKIVTFWLSALDAELGDLPESRIWNDRAAGIDYLTIHAKFDWQVCRTYRLRVAPHTVEANGDTWYGAWITDVDAEIETFIGRMLLPAGAGLLVPFSTSRTQGFVSPQMPTACEMQQTASVLYGTPTADAGALVPVQAPNNRFGQVLGCSGSRFSSFDGAVRHELNVHPQRL